jgi:anti-sigma factor RsiW
MTIELPPAEHLTYEELEAFVDGRADALERQLVEAHVELCARCSGELLDLAATRDALGLGPSGPRRRQLPL